MRTAFALLALLAFASAGRAEPDVAALIARFDSLETARVARARADTLSNSEGQIAWDWSYDLSALDEMLAATHDTLYARMFIDLGNAVAAARDDVRGRVDFLKHRVYKAWGSERYSERHHVIWEVHTAMITAPLARFAAIVLADSALAARYGSDAQRFLTMAQEAMAIHDSQYRDGLDPQEGYLLRYAQRLPVNQLCAMGRAWLFLIEAGSPGPYSERLPKLANYVRNRLRVTEDSSYVWSYAPHLEGPGSDFEDVAHGAIAADFIVLCAERGIVFNDADVARLSGTLQRHLLVSDCAVARDMSGVGLAGKPEQIFLWGRLAVHSPDVASRLAALQQCSPIPTTSESIEALWLAFEVGAANSRE